MSAETTGPAPLPVDRALLDWAGALARVEAYLAALGLGAPEVRRLGRAAIARALERPSPRAALADAMDEAHALLRERGVALPEPPAPTPPLLRRPMASEGLHAPAPDPEREERRRGRLAWRARGRLRRVALGALVVIPSSLAGAAFLEALPAQVWLPAEIALAAFFGALFGWISIGFWTALFGFSTLWRGGDRFAITRGLPPAAAPPDAACRTAVVMPICDEPVARVFAGLRAVRESIQRTGAGGAFDLFVLSDSAEPDVCVEEETAWAEWRRVARGPGGIYYRRRRVRRKRKSGNVADFCRRFGRRYRYLVVLDADSLMSGETLLRLVALMEAHPRVGIVQTAPRIVRAGSLFARIQQFAGSLYGAMFAAGMHYWQLGDSPYWGHNAILRVEPFMRHGALPRLPGRPPFGGDILSHDFVEAALLGRAGWAVWLAYDLPGSWEETPGSLLAEMRRDRRWCQGNLQHLRLLFTRGLSSPHRALFLNGVFSYVSAVLWLGFVVASTTEAVLWAVRGPDYFAAGPALFPTWPVWSPERVGSLLVLVVVVLFLPKAFALALAARLGTLAGFGGARVALRGVLLESLATALFAPIRMAFYCRFVVANLLGRAVGWSGGDDLEETGWGEAWRRHGADTAVACTWALGLYALHPAAFWWLAPLAGALVFSVPISVLASRRRLGERARAAGWCVTPEERDPPREVRSLERELAAPRDAGADRWTGFAGAVVDPRRHALHRALLRGPRSLAPRLRAVRRRLVERALELGPAGLAAAEKHALLADAPGLTELHERVWRLEPGDAARRWGLDGAPG